MMTTAIINARIFDGERTVEEQTVLLEGTKIAAVGGPIPDGVEVVDARGGTLLPGLIDAHTHTDEASLAMALSFGVTTELEMQGVNTRNNRAHITNDDGVADVRSSGFALTPPGGHPSELFPIDFHPGGGGPRSVGRDAGGQARAGLIVRPFSSTPEEAVAFIPQLVATGSDYIKFMVDDGSVEGHPNLPCLDQLLCRHQPCFVFCIFMWFGRGEELRNAAKRYATHRRTCRKKKREEPTSVEDAESEATDREESPGKNYVDDENGGYARLTEDIA